MRSFLLHFFLLTFSAKPPTFLHASFSFIFEGITWEFNSVYSCGMGRCYRWYFSHQAMTRIGVLARLQEIPESCCGCNGNPGEKTFRLDADETAYIKMEGTTNPVLAVKPPWILSLLFLCISSQILTLSFLGFAPCSGAEALGDVHGGAA